MPKLNPNAQKWVDALRSGEYKQATGKLKTNDGHCCLGVLCEIALQEGVIHSYLPDSAGLPESVRRWIGMKTSDGRYFRPKLGVNFLTNDNDRGTSFAKIAEIIEANAEELGVSA